MRARGARLLGSSALLALTLAPGAVGAQVVRGRLIDLNTDQPIPHAFVALMDEGYQFVTSTVSDSAGEFRLAAPRPASLMLYAALDGYYAMNSDLLELSAADTVDLEFRLQPIIIQLDTLAAVVRSRPPVDPRLERVGFYDRQKQGLGSFVTRETLETASPAARLGDVLRRLPGLIVGEDGSVRVRTGGALSAGCSTPLVFLEGAPWQLDEHRGINAFYPNEIEAVEVYTHLGSLPAQYGGASSACGVILIWLRR